MTLKQWKKITVGAVTNLQKEYRQSREVFKYRGKRIPLNTFSSDERENCISLEIFEKLSRAPRRAGEICLSAPKNNRTAAGWRAASVRMESESGNAAQAGVKRPANLSASCASALLPSSASYSSAAKCETSACRIPKRSSSLIRLGASNANSP